MLPSGANKEEITEMWGDKSWVPLKDELVRASLLIYKTDDLGTFVYNMLPFMSIRATEILEESPQLFNDYHMKCCRLCKDYCLEFYNSEKSIEDIEGLVSIENNIWACLNRAISTNKQDNLLHDEISITKCETTPILTQESFTTQTTDSSSKQFINDKNLLEIFRDFEMFRSIESSENLIFEEQKDSRSNLFTVNRENNSNDSSSCIDEELLVIYYITDLIFLNKNEDALRAVTEYLQKPNISILGLANLNRIYAVLLMISIDSKFAMTSVQYFKIALNYYHEVRMSKGVAVCQLGIIKIFHDKFNDFVLEIPVEQKDKFIQELLCLIKNSYELFNKINWDNGASQCKMIESSLNERIKIRTENDKNGIIEPDTPIYSSMMHEDNSILLEVLMNDERIEN